MNVRCSAFSRKASPHVITRGPILCFALLSWICCCSQEKVKSVSHSSETFQLVHEAINDSSETFQLVHEARTQACRILERCPLHPVRVEIGPGHRHSRSERGLVIASNPTVHLNPDCARKEQESFGTPTPSACATSLRSLRPTGSPSMRSTTTL